MDPRKRDLSRCMTAAALVVVLGACKSEPAPTPPPQTPQTSASVALAPSATAILATPPSALAPGSARNAASIAAPPSGTAINFDADAVGPAPSNFTYGRTGQGKIGKWTIRAEGDAPSKGNVLAQVDADDTDNRFPVAVLKEPSLKDARVRVRCKPVAGKTDQACGLVFRFADENNYFLTRANALENNVRLYTVKDGSRRQIAGWNGSVKSGVWHELKAEVKGDHIEVSWDGTKVLEHRDTTFTNAGRVGVWTKADSVTYFDDLTVEAIQ